jgi:FKBP-type peptidyl-prolyl cis-trans isomerase
MMMKSTCICLLSLLAPTAAFVAPSASQSSTRLSAQASSRADFLRDVTTAVVGVTAAAVVQQPFPAFADETLPSGVAIKVVKSGNGPQPDIGELAAIRFSSFAGENKIDDIFETPEPYYTRVGSGGLIKGVEEVLPKMRVGDRWVLTIPVSCIIPYYTIVCIP